MGRVRKYHDIILNQNEQTITFDGEKIILPFLRYQIFRKSLDAIDKYTMFYYGRRFRTNSKFIASYGNIPEDYPFKIHEKLMIDVYHLFQRRVFGDNSLVPTDKPEMLKITFIPEDLSEEERNLKRYDELVLLRRDSPDQFKELQVLDALRFWLIGNIMFGKDNPNYEDYIRDPTPSEPFLTKKEFEEDFIPRIRIPKSNVPYVEKLFPVPEELIVPDNFFTYSPEEVKAFEEIKHPYHHEKPKPKITYDTKQNYGYEYQPALFKAYLNELLDNLSIIRENPFERGRPELPIKDKLFCNIDRINSRMTTRQYPMSDNVRVAVEGGYIEKSPSPNALSQFLSDERITPILNSLLQISASPLSVCETKLAADSSGFRTYNYGEWFRLKYDRELKKMLSVAKRKELKEEMRKEIALMKKQRLRMWKKLHIIAGTKTGVIIAMRITKNEGEGTSDTVNFQPLLVDATKYFDVHECTADKGYSSRFNYEVAEKYGVKLYSPFRSNATFTPKGVKSWGDMFFEATFNAEEFSKHYNVRNNVESTFGAIKKSLGEELSSKSECGQINELYCKCIAFNIRKLIMANAVELIDTPEFVTEQARI